MSLRTVTFYFTNLPEGRLDLNQYARYSLRQSVPTELENAMG